MPPKKTAKHHDEKRHEANDLRRSYEHLGRVEILQRTVQPSSGDCVSTLAALAQQEVQSGHEKAAAELLRAAEHFSFAALASDSAKGPQLSKNLESAIREEFDRLTTKATERWEHDEERNIAPSTIYKSAVQGANKALKLGNYHQALEFARAAEALTHAKQHGQRLLKSGKERLKLSAT